MDQEHCRSMLKSLSDYVDGVLESELCAEIERHASGCENCRIVIDTLRKTVFLFSQAAAQVAVPADMHERLYHRLELDDFLKSSSDR